MLNLYMTVKERLILFIKHLGISQRAFEQSVGLSNGYVNNIRKSIQPDKVQKNAQKYPNLNTGWLMTEEGSMIKTGDINIGNVKNAGGNYGSINAGIVNNVNAYGYEKIIKPDGTIELELGKPNSKNVVGAQEIVMEYNTLQAKIKLLEEKCAAKDETIQALKMTIDVLSSKANK